MTMATIRAVRGPLDITVDVPGSKSLANRALVLSGIAGHCVVRNVPEGDDCAAMLDALVALGAGIRIEGSTVHVGQPIDRERTGAATIHARLAGTTSRFLIGVSALIAGRTTITGDEALRRRPMKDLVDTLRELGAEVSSDGGRLPVSISRGALSGGHVTVPADVSSQFISSLMMIGPILGGGLTIDLVGDAVSTSYLGLTVDVMRHFGCHPSIVGSTIHIPESLPSASSYVVPPDASSASYPLALVALHGGSVRIPGLRLASDQGDYRIVELLEQCGCGVVFDGDDVVVTRDPNVRLSAIEVDMRECSDLVPTWAVVATQCAGTSRITGVGFVRNKESDRIGDLAEELTKLGARVRTTDDGLEIDGGTLHGGSLRTHHDHRLAMAFGVLGTLIEGVSLDDPTVVSKSWPGFWTDMGIVTSP
jgi:3-phosphoshikimate 1-carboxyvinyltransferase